MLCVTVAAALRSCRSPLLRVMTPIASTSAAATSVAAVTAATVRVNRSLKAVRNNAIASVAERSNSVSADTAALQASGVEAAPLEQPRERGVAVAEALYGATHSFERANAMRKRPLQLARYL